MVHQKPSRLPLVAPRWFPALAYMSCWRLKQIYAAVIVQTPPFFTVNQALSLALVNILQADFSSQVFT